MIFFLILITYLVDIVRRNSLLVTYGSLRVEKKNQTDSACLPNTKFDCYISETFLIDCWNLSEIALCLDGDWSENSGHFLNQSDKKLKPIKTWSPTYFCTLGSLVSFTFSSHWLCKINSFLPISPGICFSTGNSFMIRSWKGHYWKFSIKIKYIHKKKKKNCSYTMSWMHIRTRLISTSASPAILWTWLKPSIYGRI